MQQGESVDDSLVHMYRLATAREPNPNVLSILAGAYSMHLEVYESDRAAALQLISEGESPRDETLDIAELAAYQMVASLIMNLDGTITRD